MKGFITYVFAILISAISCNAQTSRSFMQNEIVGQSLQGSISEIPQHAGTWVEWDSTGKQITMMDGTRWERVKSIDGLLHYRFVGSSQPLQPYTQLYEAVFKKDFSKLVIRYSFGPMGMAVQMIGRYSCLGEGKQLAEDWINIPDNE